MKVNTRIFGEIEIADEKIITFEKGIIGFPELKRFSLLYDEEKGTNVGIRFLQSIDEPAFAMPVMDPFIVKEDYAPLVSDELLSDIGVVTDESLLVLTTVTVPADLTKMSVNLQGPIIINVDECRACQMILDGSDYSVKFPIFDILQKRKAGV